MVLPHEAWFTDARPGFDWSFAATPATLALIGSAVVVAVAWRLIGRRLPTPELGFLRSLGRLGPWIPRLLAVHAGVSLLAQAARNTYLAPSLVLPDGPFGATLRIAEGVIGVWLITGYRIRPVALLVVASGPVAMLEYGVVPVLERLDLLGIALFLYLMPPGRDRDGAVEDETNLAQSILVLRSMSGAALIVLAFTEKLARPELAREFLEDFPAFNILRTLGFDVGADAFIRIAGGIELLFGLLLISGTLPQVVVIAAGIPFNATLFFLGTEELIGHLPIYGTMLALLVYGSHEATAPIVDRFPLGRPRLDVPAPDRRRRRKVTAPAA
jgi:hypothetical protein